MRACNIHPNMLRQRYHMKIEPKIQPVLRHIELLQSRFHFLVEMNQLDICTPMH